MSGSKLSRIFESITGKADRDERATIAEVFADMADMLMEAQDEQNWGKVARAEAMSREAAETFAIEP